MASPTRPVFRPATSEAQPPPTNAPESQEPNDGATNLPLPNVSAPQVSPSANAGSLDRGAPPSTSVLDGVRTQESQDANSTLRPTAIAAPSSSGRSNLSGGAVAGVAIAALIVGAVLAFATAFFFFKRRNKTNNGGVGYNNYIDSTPELVMMQKSAGRNSSYVQVSQIPLPAPLSAPAPPAPVQPNLSETLAAILPAAAHENEVQGRVATLFQQVHQHVETYYRDVHASITPSMEPELMRFGANNVNMADLLQECSSPTTVLKHALVAYIVGITSPKRGDDGETLFPEVLNGAQSQNTTGADARLSTARTLHRRLSVYLYSSANPHSTPRRSWSFQSDVREAAEHFSLTFFPWANPAVDDQDKEDDLTRIISGALETRIWLFGQPSEYDFQWDAVGARGVVVSPELLRKNEGETGGRGKVILESKVASL